MGEQGRSLREGKEEWHPIETAPKSNIPILVSGINAHGRRYTDILVWYGDEWCCFDVETDEYSYPVLPPTHWMPLPEAPSASERLPSPSSQEAKRG